MLFRVVYPILVCYVWVSFAEENSSSLNDTNLRKGKLWNRVFPLFACGRQIKEYSQED